MANIKILNNIILDPVTGSRAIKVDSSKVIGSATTTDTEQGYVSGVTSAIQTQFTNRTKNSIRIGAAMGSVILAETLEEGPKGMLGNTGAFTDARFHVVACWLENNATITGVKFYQSTQGAYTADQNTKVGLYTYSGGTLTLVASCANDANIFKAASNAWTSKAFASTFAASAGLLFVGYLANWSAVTTAPQIGAASSYANNALTGADFTNSGKLCAFLNAQTDLPASQAMSGMSVNTFMPYFGLY